jgi:NADPH:quinone reductase
MAYSANPSRHRIDAMAVLKVVQSGLSAKIGKTYPVVDASRAHAELEARAITVSSLLVP